MSQSTDKLRYNDVRLWELLIPRVVFAVVYHQGPVSLILKLLQLLDITIRQKFNTS